MFIKVEVIKFFFLCNVLVEIFVVCLGYKVFKKFDFCLFDFCIVFEDVVDVVFNNEVKVYNFEIKKRKRDGYEEGDYI